MLKDIINYRVVSVAPDTKVADVARKMSDENVGSVVVCVDNQCKGIVTDRDIVVRCIAKNVDVNDCTVEQIVSEPIESVKETDGIYDCIRKMKNQEIRRMPVVNDSGAVVGVISFDDLILLLSKEISELAEAATPASQAAQASRLRAA
jgi:CBS domain-containing protein